MGREARLTAQAVPNRGTGMLKAGPSKEAAFTPMGCKNSTYAGRGERVLVNVVAKEGDLKASAVAAGESIETDSAALGIGT